MKKIIIKVGPGVARVELEIDKKFPNYCTLAIFSPDDDYTLIEMDTAGILKLATEVLKEIG